MPERQLLGRSLPSRELSRFPARRGLPCPAMLISQEFERQRTILRNDTVEFDRRRRDEDPAPSRCLLLPPPTTRCCSGDLGPNPSRPATAPPLSEFAISASGEVDIDQLSGMPSKQSTMGERHALPAGMRNPVTSVIRSSLGLSAPKRRLPPRHAAGSGAPRRPRPRRSRGVAPVKTWRRYSQVWRSEE